MVSFSCEVCNDTVLKKKLQQHQRQCRDAYFTCIDCSTTFYGNDHQKHTSCISEAEKYEKSLYKGPKKQQNSTKPNQTQNQNQKQKQNETKKVDTEQKSSPELKKEKKKLNIKDFVDQEEIPLYKVFKSIKKKDSKLNDKTEFLKALKVQKNKDGSVTLSL